MDSEKIEVVMKFNVPKNRKDIQSYIGFLNFYRKYVKGFAELIQSTELLTKDTYMSMDENTLMGFEDSRKAFLKEIIVDYPDFNRPFYFNADASTVAIGGELFQVRDDNPHTTIVFVSRVLKPTETRYTITEQEVLALVYCCSKFHQYLVGYETIVLTDHQVLTFLKQSKLGSRRLTQWTLAFQEYQLEIRYIFG